MLKNAIGKLSPTALTYVSSFRFRRRSARKYQDFQNEIARSLFEDGQIHVMSGPFEGLKYINDIVWGPISPKWIGCYEAQLHPVVQSIIDSDYRRIIDVGAAEGYYAVGLARAKPDAYIYSFDVDPFARRLQAKLMRINDVENLRMGRYCDHETLESLCGDDSVLICDIEGSEIDLLDMGLAPSLRETDILVEIHEARGMSVTRVAELISARFEKTHEIQVIEPEQRLEIEYASIVDGRISPAVVVRVFDEDREQEQVWLWMTTIRSNARRKDHDSLLR